jgi:hypothetical protein
MLSGRYPLANTSGSYSVPSGNSCGVYKYFLANKRTLWHPSGKTAEQEPSDRVALWYSLRKVSRQLPIHSEKCFERLPIPFDKYFERVTNNLLRNVFELKKCMYYKVVKYLLRNVVKGLPKPLINVLRALLVHFDKYFERVSNTLSEML